MTVNIVQVQKLLQALDCSPGAIDGIWGTKSQAALDKACNKYGVQTSTQTDTPVQVPVQGGASFWAGIKHFKREEFRCPCGKCGGFPVEPNEKLVRFLDRARDTVWKDRAVTIIPLTGNPHNGGSGIRCRTYNATLSGSVADSRHCEGKAADIIVSGLSSGAVKSYLDQYVRSGELRYVYSITSKSTHLDVL